MQSEYPTSPEVDRFHRGLIEAVVGKTIQTDLPDAGQNQHSSYMLYSLYSDTTALHETCLGV